MEIPCANCGAWKEHGEFFTIVHGVEANADIICKDCVPEVERILNGLENRSQGNSGIPRKDAEGAGKESSG